MNTRVDKLKKNPTPPARELVDFTRIGEAVKGEYTLPREVFYQCVWIVKDMSRLERMEALAVDEQDVADGEVVFYLAEDKHLQARSVVEGACYKLNCIRTAIDTVPQEYREQLIDNIRYKTVLGDEAHANTWKYWKQRFIYRLAIELGLY